MTSQCRKVNGSFYKVQFFRKGSDKTMFWNHAVTLFTLHASISIVIKIKVLAVA